MNTNAVRRILALLLTAALVPACSYSSSGKNYVPPPPGGVPPGSTVLMSDGFFPFPGTNWTTPTLTESATATSVLSGSTYQLQLAAPTRTAGAAPTAMTRSTMSFNSHQLTIAVDLSTTAQSTVADIGSVVIESSPAHTVLARADLNSASQTLTFSVLGTSASPVVVVAGTMYRVTFTVNAGDQATWRVGTGTSTTPISFPPQMIDVSLRAAWAMGIPTANPMFVYRNMQVTTP